MQLILLLAFWLTQFVAEDAALQALIAQYGYGAAFVAIESDPNNEVIVIESEGKLVGTIQLTFLANLTHRGAWRCQVEGVRIHSDYRGRGVGTRFLEWAIERAEERGCSMVQLTSDKQRLEAIGFYEKLGFRATHEGFKRML